MLSSEQVRSKFLKYWTDDERKHVLIPNVSLVPENDSTLLFVNSGMFPLAPYLAGEKHPLGKRLCNIQRCLRTKYDEWMEIGDNRHTLMFEMMGNWSLNDFFKYEQINWMLDFYVKELGLDINRIYVSVWGGNENIPIDKDAIEIWINAFKRYGVNAKFSEDISKIPASIEDGRTNMNKIFPYGRKHNWWQRGDAVGELGGPSSEIFYDVGKVIRKQKIYHINDDSFRFLEIGNSVFMQYVLDDNMMWIPLKQQNVDFGGGFERTVMCVQGKNDIFETDIYYPIIQKIESISGKSYKNDDVENENTSAFRVISDHARAATFIIADGILPSNKDQGYILRRFVRRLVRFGLKLGIENEFTHEIAQAVIDRMKVYYPYLEDKKDIILSELNKEEVRFRATMKLGLREFDRIYKSFFNNKNSVSDIKFTNDGDKNSFWLYETYGFPPEMTLEELCNRGINIDEQIFWKNHKLSEDIHRQKSKLGAEKKFKGGLADHSPENTRYHTLTHILLRALQIILGSDVHQAGCNITPERIRLDFTYNGKITSDTISKVEQLVNEKIAENLEVKKEKMNLEEARASGAEGVFDDKYGDFVYVYTIFNPKTQEVYSKEICGGPHVQNTSEIASFGKFKILKVESVSAGVKRIKAVLIK